MLKLPVMPATDPTLTIEPPPDSLISGAQVWMPLRVPVTLISKILFHSSMSTFGNRNLADERRFCGGRGRARGDGTRISGN